MCSRNESMLEDIPEGDLCYCVKDKQCNCEHDCNCKVDLVKKFCPYFVYIDNGLTKCTLINVTSEDDELFSHNVKICGFNETKEERNVYVTFSEFKMLVLQS
jgi:hypothetical protein